MNIAQKPRRPLRPGTLLMASSPCPWCGKLPVSEEGLISGWVVRCSSTVPRECSVRPSVWRPTREQAEEAWCKRRTA